MNSVNGKEISAVDPVIRGTLREQITFIFYSFHLDLCSCIRYRVPLMLALCACSHSYSLASYYSYGTNAKRLIHSFFDTPFLILLTLNNLMHQFYHEIYRFKELSRLAAEREGK